jgi:hypothetical protein
MDLMRLPWERWAKKTGKATTKAKPPWEVGDDESPEKKITTRAGRGVKRSTKLK